MAPSAASAAKSLKQKWAEEQKHLVSFVEESERLEGEIKFVAGVDISFVNEDKAGEEDSGGGDDDGGGADEAKQGPSDACVALVIVKYPGMSTRSVHRSFTIIGSLMP
jgi:hypothetical protein